VLYIAKPAQWGLADQLLEDFGIQFFAKPRRNMKNFSVASP
jgi:hypothetical protein